MVFFREAAADCVYVQSLLMALFTKSNADSDESLQLIVYITFCWPVSAEPVAGCVYRP